MFAGTSGFAYPGWAPRFYPTGLPAKGFLGHYAERLPAVELNNTYYASPKADKVAAWVAATPPDFRFSVKAQRGGSFRSLAVDPGESVAWLTGPYRALGSDSGPSSSAFPRTSGAMTRSSPDSSPRGRATCR